MRSKLLSKRYLIVSAFTIICIVAAAFVLNMVLVKPAVKAYGDIPSSYVEQEEQLGIKMTDSGIQYRIEDTEDEKYVVILGFSRGGELVIPETVEGLPVKAIGQTAFVHEKSLIRVSIPETVLFVDSWAFASCSSLKEVIVLNPDVEYGSDVFADTNVTIYSFDPSTSKEYAEANYLMFEVLK